MSRQDARSELGVVEAELVICLPWYLTVHQSSM